ncbi:hypothetical protein [Streptomyces reticuliscabiei]|nr:hypothetical protein [Streptomyces reticuliscabiei]
MAHRRGPAVADTLTASYSDRTTSRTRTRPNGPPLDGPSGRGSGIAV